MKMKYGMAIAGLLMSATLFAQSKVFKEVSGEMSSQMKIITQDEALIGYVMFTQLEKANKDSFNYQLSIMDENLNDIGKVKFREKNLELQAVSFDQDVLCLAYLKSDLADLKNASIKDIKRSVDDGRSAVFTQLINLQGEMIASHTDKVNLTLKTDAYTLKRYSPTTVAGALKHSIQLKNMAGKGFAIFYGDDDKNSLVAFDVKGKELWKKSVPEADAMGMLTSAAGVYMLSKQKSKMTEGGYELIGYNGADGASSDSYKLKDKKGNELKVLDFETDAATGKPVITGTIINTQKGNNLSSVKWLHKGIYDGVFTIMINGPKKTDIIERYSYWQDGSKTPDISAEGNLPNDLVPQYTGSIRDFKGNTYFVGSAYHRKVRVGGIVSSIILAPIILPSIILMSPGTHKSRQEDALLLRQDSAGRLQVDNYISKLPGRYLPSTAPLSLYEGRGFYSVTNATTRSNFLIVDDSKAAAIYNVDKRKIVREVPHKDGNISTYIFPAKEGHIMVMEFNKKAKETRLSIEELQ